MRILLIIFSLFSLHLPIFSKELSLADAIEHALTYSPDALSAGIDREKNRLNTFTLWNALLPSGGLSGSTGISNRRTTDNPAVTDSGSLSLGIDGSLSLSPELFIGMFEKVRENSFSSYSYIKNINAIRRDISKAYYALKLTAEELSIKEKNTEILRTRFENGKALYKSGEAGEIELLKREYAWRSSIHELEELKNTYMKNTNAFKQLINMKSGETFTLTDPLPEINTDCLTRLETVKPEEALSAKALAIELERSNIQLLYGAASYLPSFGIGTSLGLSLNGNPYDGSTSLTQGTYTVTNSLRLSVSLPISGYLPFSKQQVNSLKYALDRKKALLAHEKEISRLTDELQTLKNELTYTITTYENALFNAQIALKVTKLTEKAYYEGTKEYIELITSEEDYRTALFRVLQARLSFTLKILDFEYMYSGDL